MKRSEINKVIKDMENLLRQCHFYLTEFASWSPDKWKNLKSDAREIVDNRLGWDITDYGTGKFWEYGFSSSSCSSATCLTAGSLARTATSM